jgi:hypothetical protein
MNSVLNCYNVAKYTKFYMGWLNVTSTVNAGCTEKSLQWYSKCY